MQTPDYSHLTSKDFERIYEPSEDTFLLLDALEADLDWLTGPDRPSICLEIGSGSGVVITALSLLQHSPFCISTDKDPFACEKSFQTGKGKVDVVCTDLVSCLGDRLASKVDLIVFNPPYVPTDVCEVDDGEKRRWAGGLKGREVTDRVLPLVWDLLAPKGRFYLVLVKENDPEEVCLILRNRGFHTSICLERRCGSERLCVVKAVKPGAGTDTGA